ncbi:MAG: hypothetical protein V1716_05450 [Candidatus Uhrbacteria bacterium]
MKIGIIGSMQFTEKMMELRDRLIDLGHESFLTGLAEPFVGKTDEEKEQIKIHQKMNCDAIREFWDLMQDGDAVLVTNYKKHGVPNYIGANTFLEMGFAHVLNQKIFCLNPLPDNNYLKTELEAMRPIIIDGDLTKIE